VTINASVKTIAVTQPMTRLMSSVIFAAFAFKFRKVREALSRLAGAQLTFVALTLRHLSFNNEHTRRAQREGPRGWYLPTVQTQGNPRKWGSSFQTPAAGLKCFGFRKCRQEHITGSRIVPFNAAMREGAESIEDMLDEQFRLMYRTARARRRESLAA
jgi:hypothetical protein